MPCVLTASLPRVCAQEPGLARADLSSRSRSRRDTVSRRRPLEREREKERERERERKRESESERERKREKKRERDRERERKRAQLTDPIALPYLAVRSLGFNVSANQQSRLETSAFSPINANSCRPNSGGSGLIDSSPEVNALYGKKIWTCSHSSCRKSTSTWDLFLYQGWRKGSPIVDTTEAIISCPRAMVSMVVAS